MKSTKEVPADDKTTNAVVPAQANGENLSDWKGLPHVIGILAVTTRVNAYKIKAAIRTNCEQFYVVVRRQILRLIGIARKSSSRVMETFSFYRPALIGLLMMLAVALWFLNSKTGNFVWSLIRDGRTPTGLSNDFVTGLVGNLASGTIELVFVLFIVDAMLKRMDRKKWQGLRRAVLSDFTPHHISLIKQLDYLPRLLVGSINLDLMDDRFADSVNLFVGEDVRVTHVLHSCKSISAHADQIDQLYLAQRHLFDSATIEEFGRYLVLVNDLRERCDMIVQDFEWVKMAENYCHAAFKTMTHIPRSFDGLKMANVKEMARAYAGFYRQFSGAKWQGQNELETPEQIASHWKCVDLSRLFERWHIKVSNETLLSQIGFEAEYWVREDPDATGTIVLKPTADAEEHYRSPFRISESAMMEILRQRNRYDYMHTIRPEFLSPD
jgi:hypothetical protein